MQQMRRQDADTYTARRRKRKLWQRVVSLLTCAVVFCTTYAMILPAITMEADRMCELEEHIHTDACYSASALPPQLSCQEEEHIHIPECYDETGALLCEAAEHAHEDTCYEAHKSELACEIPEHTHSLICYCDPTADMETEQQWEKAFASVTLTGDPAEDLLAIAKTQLGYSESSRNFTVLEDGTTTRGYTRYGAWADTPYAEWNQLFVEFCLAYAGIYADTFPRAAEGMGWMSTLVNEGLMLEAGQTPAPGDLIFLKLKGQTFVGIVRSVSEEGYVSAILGDYNQEVAQETWTLGDSAILGYARVPYGESFAQEAAVFALRSAAVTSTDLTPYIDDIVVYHKTTAWGDVWQVLPENEPLPDSELVRFAISYILPGYTLGNGVTSVHYQLPVTQVAEEKGGSVYNSEGVHVGNYVISTSGLVSITFFEYYVSENAIGRQIAGVVNFDSSVDQLDKDNDNVIDLEFTDSESVYIEIQETIRDDLTVQKQAQVLDEATGLVRYTVTISSVNGTAEEVKITDWMTNVAYESGFTVIKNAANGSTSSVAATAPAGGATSISMNLPKLGPGEGYTITYNGRIKDVSTGTVTANNGITVTSKNEDGDDLNYSTSVEVKYDYTMLEKSGTVQSDETVKWTILVGRAGESLEGWTLSDTVNAADLEEDVTITFPDGSSVVTKLPYTFGKVNGVVTVTYTTDLEYRLGSGTMRNVATLTPPDPDLQPEYTDGDNVVGPGDNSWDSYNPLDKQSGGLSVSPDKTTAVIGWTLTINADDGGIYPRYAANGDNRGWFFQDQLMGDQYYTDEQWAALEQAVHIALTNVFQWNEAQAQAGYDLEKITGGSGTVGFKVTVYEVLEKGRSFTISYESTASLGDGSESLTFSNNATINDKVWAGDSAHYIPTVTKMDASGSSGDSTKALMDLQDGIIGWKIQLYLPESVRGSKVTMIEDLPDQVELSSVTLTMPDNSTVTFRFDENGNGTATAAGCTLTAVLTKDNGDQKMTVVLPVDFVSAYAQQKLIFNVSTKLPADFTIPEGAEVVVLNNSVSVRYGDQNTELDSDDQSQTITGEDTSKKIVKSAGEATNNVIPYSVVLNPNGSDLLKDFDTMTVQDKLEFWNYSATDVFGATLVPGSVRLYEIDADGNVVKDLTDTVTYSYSQTTEYPWGNDQHKVVSTLEIQVPDSTRLRLEYSYKISGNVHTGVNLTNVASLRELNQEAESTHYEWFYINESDAEANLYSVNIYKVDADNYATLLEGAHYELYKYVVDAATGTGEWHFDHIVVSDGESSLELKDLVVNQAYYLVETEAPDGYILDQTRHYFLIYDPNTKDADGNVNLIQPSGFPSSAYVAKGGSVFIENRREFTSIHAQKQWLEADGTAMVLLPKEGVKVQLMRVWNRYPVSFNTDSLGAAATVKLTFGQYSYMYGLYDQSYSVKTGDLLTITLVTTDLHEKAAGDVDEPGLMDITDSENIHLIHTKESTGGTDGSGNPLYRYTFHYLVKGNAELHGWVFPENKDYVDVNVSVTDYSNVTLQGTPSAYGGPVTLSADNNWQHRFSGLPVYELSSIGKITGYYSYYVQEIEPPAGFTVSYSGPHSRQTADFSGTVTITNRQIAALEVEKKWVDSSGLETEAPPDVTQISFKLHQIRTYPDGTTATVEYGPYSITAEDGWSWNSSDTDVFRNGLPITVTDTVGEAQCTYYVTEVTEGYTVTYTTSQGTETVTSGTITITNQHDWKKVSYELPNTGGPGTFLMTFSGVLLCGGSLMLCRKRKGRKEENS